MTAGVEKTPECELGMCRLCAGPREIYAGGYSVPVLVIRCECGCHCEKPRPGRAPQV